MGPVAFPVLCWTDTGASLGASAEPSRRTGKGFRSCLLSVLSGSARSAQASRALHPLQAMFGILGFGMFFYSMPLFYSSLS